MSSSSRGTLLDIPLVEERFGKAFLASIGIHVSIVAFLVFIPYLLPTPAAIQIGGSGPGGGTGGESYTVGVADELAGGTGYTKPSLVPQPPPLPADKPAKEEPKQDAVPLPATIEKKAPKQKKEDKVASESKKPLPAATGNVIPTSPQPGAGGSGGVSGGSGGGRGGGVGVSIGSGSGGFGDSWYARTVESRISSNWVRPGPGVRVEVTYIFFIAADGSIYGISKEKSSGNVELDLMAERAIRASNPLAPPPPEFRGRPVQFVAQFVYPPNQ